MITDTNEPEYERIRAHRGIVFADVGFQVLLYRGSRQFTDVTFTSTAQNLGRRDYFSLTPIDINNDAFADVVGLYTTDAYGAHTGGQWGTTLFLNDGTGAFQVVDGTQALANPGSFVPSVVNAQYTEGIFFESVGGCNPRSCSPVGLNLYKVVSSRSLGTGPDFADSAALGVPGFNEFYYLRHYPDAAAAVQAGQYRTGLAHYVSVGIHRGYRPHAPDRQDFYADRIACGRLEAA